MSTGAILLCWRHAAGLSLETRGGLYDVLVDRKGADIRLVNNVPVDSWPDNSRTAKRLEQLFQELRDSLVELNDRASDPDQTEYRALYWKMRNRLKGD